MLQKHYYKILWIASSFYVFKIWLIWVFRSITYSKIYLADFLNRLFFYFCFFTNGIMVTFSPGSIWVTTDCKWMASLFGIVSRAQWVLNKYLLDWSGFVHVLLYIHVEALRTWDKRLTGTRVRSVQLFNNQDSTWKNTNSSAMCFLEGKHVWSALIRQ